MYNGTRGVIDDVAFLSFSTPRASNIRLAGPLRAAGLDVRLVGDARTARNVLAATADGHDLGNAL